MLTGYAGLTSLRYKCLLFQIKQCGSTDNKFNKNSNCYFRLESIMTLTIHKFYYLKCCKRDLLCFQNQRGFLQWRVYNDEDRLVLCYSVLVQTQTPMEKFIRNYKNQELSYYTLPVKYIKYTRYNSEESEKAEKESLHKIIGNYYKNWKVK